MATRNFSGTLSVGKETPLAVGGDLGRHQAAVAAPHGRRKGSSKSVRGRNKQYPAASMATTSIAKKHILFLAGFLPYFYVSLAKLPKIPHYENNMPCFVCAVRPAHRLVQQADVRHHRMVDQRSDGRQDASPRDVRRKRTSRGKRHAGCHIDHPGRRFRRLPVGGCA